MEDHPFQEPADSLISVCSHLLDGAALRWVHHLPDEPGVWFLTCDDKLHEQSHITQITLEDASRMFPEIKELANIPRDKTVWFMRGYTSGNWVDFLPSK